MATFLAKIKVFEGKEAEFEEIARMMFRETHAHEQACKRYEYWRGAEPRSYYCMESFDDYNGFLLHQTSDHHEAPDFGALLESIDLEWIDPIQDACDLSPTDTVELPADATELMKQYAENMPVVMQNWWLALRK